MTDAKTIHELDAATRTKAECAFAEGHGVGADFTLPSDRAWIEGYAAALAAQGQEAEPVGWQFLQDGKWHNGMENVRDHRANTEAAGIPTRDVFAHPHRAQADAPSQAARDVLAERQRQISVEGWTPEHDDEHSRGEIAVAAACYAAPDGNERAAITPYWPWEPGAWKPSTPRRDLIKAGALILAEIERLDRNSEKHLRSKNND